MKTNKIILGFIVVIITLCQACTNEETASEPTINENEIPTLQYTITKRLPHDTTAFTEGLYIQDNKFFESTGGTKDIASTKSLFGILDTNTGKIQSKVVLDKSKYFGEGITQLGNKIYQLTYQTKIGFIYDATNYKQIGTFTIPSAEGWGFTNDGTHLIMSDGTDKLLFLNPENLSIIKTLNVSENSYAINLLNELEYVNGFIYANIYTTNNIVKIDASNGKVVAKLDANAVANEARQTYNGCLEMNGIAFDKSTNKFYVTGKMWPTMFELELK